MTDDQRKQVAEIQGDTCPEGTPVESDCCVETRFLLQLIQELEEAYKTVAEDHYDNIEALHRSIDCHDTLKQQRDEYARALVEACTKQDNWQDHELVDNAYEKAKQHFNNEEEK